MREILQRLGAIAAVWCACSFCGWAYGEDLGTWYVPDEAFDRSEPPDWVLESAVKCFITGAESTLGVELVDRAAALGATVAHGPGVDPYFPLLRDDPASGVPPETARQIHAVVDRAKGHGMHYVMGVSPYAPVTFSQAHPEWMVFYSPEDTVESKAAIDVSNPENRGARSLGLNSPWGAILQDCLVEIARDFKADAFSFDGNYHPAINYAPYERVLYETETGRPFPATPDLSTPEYRHYLLWADTKLENWYRHLRERMRETNPEAAIYTWTTNAGRYGHLIMAPRVMSARMNMIFDCPVQEWWLDDSNIGSSVIPAFGAAYVRAVSGGRVGACEPYLMSRSGPYNADSFPGFEIVARCCLAMTNGAFAPLCLYNPGNQDAIDRALREMGRRKPWVVHAQSVPWAALLVSEQTREFYAFRDPMGRYLVHPLGMFRTALEEHLPLTIINDLDVTPERLAPFRVLVLAGTACLSNRQLEAIRGFVRQGGGLVATCDASLCDEFGLARSDFGLKDLFGTSYAGRPGVAASHMDNDSDKPLVMDDSSFWGPREHVGALRWTAADVSTPDITGALERDELVRIASATIKAPMAAIAEPAAPMHQAMMLFVNMGPDVIPIASAGETGGGRVVYFGAGLDAAYFNYPLPCFREILAQAFRWAAKAPFPIRIEAPMCVQTTFFEQNDARGSRWVIHFYNGVDTTADHGWPPAETPLREEALPIARMRACIDGFDFTRAHWEPDGTDLEPETSDVGTVIALPTLEVHAMLVLEK